MYYYPHTEWTLKKWIQITSIKADLKHKKFPTEHDVARTDRREEISSISGWTNVSKEGSKAS